jgi:hypothetical protein
MSERTKGPWSYERSRFKSDGEYDYAISAVINGKTLCIGEVFGRVSDDIRPDAAANAAAIVKWENSYDALVKALKLALLFIDPDEPPSPISNRAAAEAIRAALEKAES